MLEKLVQKILDETIACQSQEECADMIGSLYQPPASRALLRSQEGQQLAKDLLGMKMPYNLDICVTVMETRPLGWLKLVNKRIAQLDQITVALDNKNIVIWVRRP